MTSQKHVTHDDLCPVTKVLESIRHQDDGQTLRRQLERVPRAVLEAWTDEGGLDVLHHSILENNAVAIATFFSRGFFKPPHEPPALPYVHLACHLGHKAIVLLLLQERPHDNRPASFSFRHAHSLRKQSIDSGNLKSALKANETKLVTPLDVAASEGHVSCVQSLLDLLSSPGRGRSSTKMAACSDYLYLACFLDSPEALRLLLCAEEATQEQLKRALEISLKSAKAECVDILLRHGIDTRTLFGGMNLYHVLYAYSYTSTQSWYESLVTVTSVLLRQKHDVMAYRPSRTYPLYSLITCLLPADPEHETPYIFAAMLLLLNSGADPNVDEVLIEERVNDDEFSTALGRIAHASGIHCVMQTVTLCTTGDEHVERFMFKATEILLRHGADPCYVGRLNEAGSRGNSLHALAMACGHLECVSLPTLRLLLRHGGDPDVAVDGRCPLQLFCEQLFKSHRTVTEQTSTDGRRLAVMLHYMTFSATQALQRWLREGGMSVSPSSETELEFLRSAVEEELKSGWTLRRFCLSAIWRYCRRNYAFVRLLPIPILMQAEMIKDL